MSAGYGTGGYAEGEYGDPGEGDGDAGGGGGDSGGGGDGTYTLTITNDGSGATTYTVEVDGSLTWNTTLGSVQPEDDAIDGATATGLVDGGVDALDIEGAITRFEADGPTPTTAINGTDVLPHNLTRTTMTKTATIELTIEESHDLTAHVVDRNGTAIEGATVTLSGPTEGEASTDADGEVVFESLADGDYTLEATYDGDSASATFSVPDDSLFG